MDQQFQPLEAHEDRRGNGIGVAVSLAAHFGILTFLWMKYAEPITVPEAPLRYIQLIREPRTFVEAPGPKTETASPDALYSDANRRASTPNPRDTRPTQRPGPEDSAYVPGGSSPPVLAAAAAQPSSDDFQYRVGEEPALPPSANSIDWRSAIREVGKIASLGGAVGSAGGEEGFAESGPISFETQWYDWGEYAKGMVARIRRHWYDNMPPIVRMGLKGVVTIRFTIERNGTISEIVMLNSSGIPPYDFAAKKAIELASPLASLPADYPNPRERVTAQFFYNQRAR